jgi:uncharacterized protein YdhG (YjbR/CyaY superfamily)
MADAGTAPTALVTNRDTLGPHVMPTAIDTYLAALAPAQRTALADLRSVITAAVPGAEDAIRTRVPAIRYRGKTVVGFGAAERHLALYVMFGAALTTLRDELAPFETSNTVVRFTPDRPLPAALVRKIVAVRLAEIDTQLSTSRGR